MNERIHKFLAQRGHGSRRQIEAWLKQGKITDSNGMPYPIGHRIGTKDRIYIDGKEVAIKPHGNEATRVLVYHKPEGEICSVSDPSGRPTIYDRLPNCGTGRKWISAGRLDLNTSGLMLFSSNGELVHGLTHPSREIAREYRCRIWGEVSKDALERLRRGIRVKSQLYRFDEAAFINSAGGANSWYRVILRRGRNREVRRAWEAAGCKVSRLIRVRYGSIVLPKDLPPGQWRELEKRKVDVLIKEALKPGIGTKNK